jgi:hypothetical protein
MTTFEVVRVMFYLFILVNGAIHLPGYLTFSKLNFRKARSNPDYMLCDEKTFQDLNKK